MIGNNCSIGYYFSILAGADVVIDDNVLIASHVLIASENHGNDPEGIHYVKQPLLCSPVRISSGVWIGEKVVLLPGVSIGERSIIGAGSVVTSGIPPFCIAAGNPARIIKKYNHETHKWEKVDPNNAHCS